VSTTHWTLARCRRWTSEDEWNSQRNRSDEDPACTSWPKHAAQAARRPGAPRARQALYLKQGRNAQFGSAEERDAWLASEAAALEQALGVKQAARGELDAQAQRAGAELRDLAQARFLLA